MNKFTCPNCQWEFHSGDPNSLYCSSDCHVEADLRQELALHEKQYGPTEQLYKEAMMSDLANEEYSKRMSLIKEIARLHKAP